jgi:large subunit ribosomal protein L13
MLRKTTVLKAGQVQPKWWVVDADGMIVGRLAARIARVLMGKQRPDYTPHVLCGDYVVVKNADKVVLTGKKWEQKEYRWYTGYPGQKVETAGRRLERRPELILREAVRRMLPKNKLARRMLARLKIYTSRARIDPVVRHQAQKPKPFESIVWGPSDG